MKRTLDVAVAGLVLLAVSPLLCAIALLVRWKLGRPVLYADERAGLNGEPFTMWKFRTMTDARGADGRLLPDEERLTALGRFLRRSSLDELPELANVLRGHMSLVGPRPLPRRYLRRYTPEQARRLTVKPGVTGLAQVSGRNALSWEQRFALDVSYVDRSDMWLDLKILAATALVILRREGVSHPGHATMHEFMGSSR